MVNMTVDQERFELKGMPHNEEAERVCLGSILLESANTSIAVEHLAHTDFYRQAHKLICEAIFALFNSNAEIDPVLVGDQLVKMGQLANAGGLEYLDALTEGIPRTGNLPHYIKVIKEKAQLRKMARFGQDLSQEALLPETVPNEALARAEDRLFDLREGGSSGRGFTRLNDALTESYRHVEMLSQNKGELAGLSTGFSDLDRITNGLHPGDLIIVAARPAMGKTSFCMNVGLNAALNGSKVAIYSLEMPTAQLTTRMMGSEARVGISALRSGRLRSEDWSRLGGIVSQMSDAHLFIEDSGDSTVPVMRAELKRHKKKHGLDLIIIDYLQLMTHSSHQAQQSRVQEVSAISRGLKALAKETGCPVIALSQLSRAVEQRTDKRPMLSDLRESGSIEQDADMVCFLYRDDYYNDKDADGAVYNQDDFSMTELIIAKHRNGPTGKIDLAFFKQFTRFENYSDDIDYT